MSLDPAAGTEPRAVGSKGWGERHVLAIGFALLAVLLMVQMTRSFWIDELVTRWVIDEDLATAWRRGGEFQSSGPLFYALMWVWSAVVGTSEIALRLPGLLAMGGAAYLLARLGAELDRRLTGLVAAFVFLTDMVVFEYTPNARPYTFELLLVVASMLCLVRWLRTDRPRYGVLWVATGALALYFQPFAALALPAQAMVIGSVGPEERRALIARARPYLLLGALLTVPLLPYLVDVAGRNDLLGFAPEPTVGRILLRMFAPALAIGLITGIALARGMRELDTFAGWRLHLPVAWAVLPFALIWLYSSVTGTSIFLDRYWMVAAPGVALVAGMLLARVGTRRGRTIALAVTVGLLLATRAPTVGEDRPWKAMIEWANEAVDGGDAVFVFRPSLVEARDSRFVIEEEASAYLTVPVVAYPVTGPVVALPSDREGVKGDYVEQVLEDEILGHDHVVILGPADNRFGETDFSVVWRDRFEREGYERVDAPGFARLRVDLWTRR